MSSSNCLELPDLISQEAGQVVWYSHLFKNHSKSQEGGDIRILMANSFWCLAETTQCFKAIILQLKINSFQSCPIPCDSMDCGTPGFPVHHQLPELLKPMSTESAMPSSHLILCHPLLLLPSVFLSIRVFSNESVLCIRWLKYWHFSFNISPSNEYSGLVSFKIDWFDLLADLGTLKSLLQHHSSKASVLQCSAFYSPTLTSIHDDWKNNNFD